jgi:hypothetical protein
MADFEVRQASVRWGRILGMLTAVFLVVEAGAQAYFAHWTGRPYGSIFLYLWSPYGLVRNNPKITGNYSISADGFREVRTYHKTPPKNTLRILLLGGSVLYSGTTPINSLEYVPSDKTISQYLTADLKADPAFYDVNVEVINAGVSYNRIVEVSSAYLADYIHWAPDLVVVFGSANNFDHALRQGDVDKQRTALQSVHPWRGEFDRLVNERSLRAAIEGVFRQAVDASATLALLHKAMMRGFVENDPFARLSIRAPTTPSAEHPLATAEEEARYFSLYESYASAMIAAARYQDEDIAFVWEYHLGDLGGLKTLSPDEQTIYRAVKRPLEEIEYDRRTRDRWIAFFAGKGVATVDPLEAIIASRQTVFNDYLHYTASGNAIVAQAVYDQLREGLVRRLAKVKYRTTRDQAP